MAIHLEEILQETGGCGRYQVILSLFVHLCKIVLCFSLIFMTFGALVPDWWCVDDFIGQNNSLPLYTTNASNYKSCTTNNGTNTCRHFVFDQSTRTVVSEWSLVCDNAWITTTITSLQMAGVFVGNLVGGHVADLIGRKPPLYGAICAMTVLNFAAVFTKSWILFAIIRFLLGVAAGFHLVVMYSIQSEFTLARWRTWVVAVPSWPLSVALFSLIAWLLKDWRYLHIFTAAVGVPSFITCWYVPESFRWKVVHDRVDDAKNIIKFVAKVNGKPAPDMQRLDEFAMNIKMDERHHQNTDRKYSLLDLTKSRYVLKCSLLLMFTWFTLGLGSYGITFGIQALSGNIYINIFIVSIIGSPLQFISISYKPNQW